MKSIKRILLGIISSSLLAAGFVRAAGDLDPMTASLRSAAVQTIADAAAEPCNGPCDFDDPT